MTMERIEKAEVLQESYITPDSVNDGRFSKTSQFMVPAIDVNISNPIAFKFFVNAYLTDIEHKHDYERPIFMLFAIKNFDDYDWKRVYAKLIQKKNFITEYDVGIQNGKYLLMIVFQVPKEFEEDYINFRLGRYSKFSEAYKKKFPEYIDIKKKIKNIHWQVIHKDPDLKRDIEIEYNMEYGELDRPTIEKGITYPPAQEIWEKPRKERESYRYLPKVK